MHRYLPHKKWQNLVKLDELPAIRTLYNSNEFSVPLTESVIRPWSKRHSEIFVRWRVHQKSEANLKWILRCISTITCYSCSYYSFMISRKHLIFCWFYKRRNKSEVKSIETRRTTITHLFTWSDQESCTTSRFSSYWWQIFFRYYFTYK